MFDPNNTVTLSAVDALAITSSDYLLHHPICQHSTDISGGDKVATSASGYLSAMSIDHLNQRTV